jgi:hypothetical protein
MIRIIAFIDSVLVVLLAAALFVYPPIRAFLDIRDPALKQRSTSNLKFL